MASLEELRSVRLEKLKLLKDFGMNAYPAKTDMDFTISDIVKDFVDLKEKNKEVKIVGRIMSIRGQGAIIFVSLFDGTGKFQAVFKKDEIEESLFNLFTDAIDMGDFIQVAGTLFTTERGQDSILVNSWTVLTKSLAPIPSEHFGIEDPDERFRKRYLDILLNGELREVFEKKAKFWEATRDFLKNRNFLEVETPTLEVTTGGAEARPFITHHNDYDMPVYLRISVGELWQKRLMASGMPRTFEIGRVYRNEGSSPEHLQEFTNMEFYASYMDYREGMKLTEEMLKEVAFKTFGTYEFTIKDFEVNLNVEWPVIEYVPYVLEKTGINVLETSEDEMKKKLDELGVSYEGENRERLMDTLWKYCRKQIGGPTWLIHHPKLVSPLAKACVDDNRIVERCQLILGGAEVFNGFSELNDPIDQRERFEVQKKLIDAGDDEAMMPDWEFVEMQEYGMPPAFGFAYGDRLFAFLVNKPIRETQLFPLMKPKEIVASKKKETMVAIAVVNTGVGLVKWQEMNTVAHLTAAFGARVGKGELMTKNTITSKDSQEINLNIKNAILIKNTDSVEELRALVVDAKKAGLEVDEFTREMLETTNDKKITEITASKNFDEIEYLGVLVYGPKESVDKLTSEFSLFS